MSNWFILNGPLIWKVVWEYWKLEEQPRKAICPFNQNCWNWGFSLKQGVRGHRFVKTKVCRSKTLKYKNKNLLEIGKKIKEKLSYLDLYSIKLSNICCNDITYSLSRFKFELLLDTILIKFKKLLNNLAQKYPDINYTILVGGTNKISYIQNIIKKVFREGLNI